MGALELGREAESKDENPHELLHGLARVYQMIDGDARERVRRIVKESGALPVARDTPCFAAVLQMLNDGASQRQEHVRGSRRAVPAQRHMTGRRRRTASPRTVRGPRPRPIGARRQRDAKEAKPRSLLGDLPSLERRRPEVEDDDDDYVEPALEVYKQRQSDDVPPEFRCAINGHLGEGAGADAVRLGFERATTLLARDAEVCAAPHASVAHDARRFDRRPRPARAHRARGSSPRRPAPRAPRSRAQRRPTSI